MIKILPVILLTGCSTMATVEKVGDAMDEASVNAFAVSENYLCKKTRVAIVMEKYGKKPEMLASFLTLCGYR